jgi:predicted nucleic acid-binding protein
MRQGGVCPVDEAIALRAAAISAEKGLPMVDSLILATGAHLRATLWTQDSHFQHIEGVKYIAPKKK